MLLGLGPASARRRLHRAGRRHRGARRRRAVRSASPAISLPHRAAAATSSRATFPRPRSACSPKRRAPQARGPRHADRLTGMEGGTPEPYGRGSEPGPAGRRTYALPRGEGARLTTLAAAQEAARIEQVARIERQRNPGL